MSFQTPDCFFVPARRRAERVGRRKEYVSLPSEDFDDLFVELLELWNGKAVDLPPRPRVDVVVRIGDWQHVFGLGMLFEGFVVSSYIDLVEVWIQRYGWRCTMRSGRDKPLGFYSA